MTDDFFYFGTLGGRNATSPDSIAELFEGYTLGKYNKEPAINDINVGIDFFRNWAYRQADGELFLLQQIDRFTDDLYRWLKEGQDEGQLDPIEQQRLTVNQQGLVGTLEDYIPKTLLANGKEAVYALLDELAKYEYACDYPKRPSFKWQKAEIERLGLIGEKIRLIERLIKKTFKESAEKYHYWHRLDELKSEIISYTGTLRRSLEAFDWAIIDEEKGDYKVAFSIHLSNIKNIIAEEIKSQNKTDLPVGKEQGGNPETPPPSIEKAYQSCCLAERESGLTTDKELYEYLKQNPFEGYELPSFKSWKTYVSKGRNFYDTKKNTPRAARPVRAPKAKDDPNLLAQISNNYIEPDEDKEFD